MFTRKIYWKRKVYINTPLQHEIDLALFFHLFDINIVTFIVECNKFQSLVIHGALRCFESAHAQSELQYCFQVTSREFWLQCSRKWKNPLRLNKVLKKSDSPLRMEKLDHPVYNPDLDPSDFHVFILLKDVLSLHHFRNNTEVKKNFRQFLVSQSTEF